MEHNLFIKKNERTCRDIKTTKSIDWDVPI